jgi:FKBP-type peptidyl-prolyl cis-trans isomerase
MFRLSTLLRLLTIGLCVVVTARSAEQQTTAGPSAPVAPVQMGITTASGLTYVVTHEGHGRRPQSGEMVFVHYTVLLNDGTKIESSLDGGEPFDFLLGGGGVIKGMDEAVANLGLGDEAVLIVPPHLGYGDKGAGKVIPPGATLIFLIHMVDIRPRDKVLSNVLMDVTMTQGLAAAIKRYQELRSAKFADLYTSEGDMESLGYQLIKKKRLQDAVAFLRLNTEAYPQSADALATLADALKRSGDKAQALRYCKMALVIDPKNRDAIDLLGVLQAP